MLIPPKNVFELFCITWFHDTVPSTAANGERWPCRKLAPLKCWKWSKNCSTWSFYFFCLDWLYQIWQPENDFRKMLIPEMKSVWPVDRSRYPVFLPGPNGRRDISNPKFLPKKSFFLVERVTCGRIGFKNGPSGSLPREWRFFFYFFSHCVFLNWDTCGVSKTFSPTSWFPIFICFRFSFFFVVVCPPGLRGVSRERNPPGCTTENWF